MSGEPARMPRQPLHRVSRRGGRERECSGGEEEGGEGRPNQTLGLRSALPARTTCSGPSGDVNAPLHVEESGRCGGEGRETGLYGGRTSWRREEDHDQDQEQDQEEDQEEERKESQGVRLLRWTGRRSFQQRMPSGMHKTT